MNKIEEIDFLSIKEMATLIRVHVNTIRRGIRIGKINAFRVGGPHSAYRIHRTEINKLAFEQLEEVINSLIDKKLK